MISENIFEKFSENISEKFTEIFLKNLRKLTLYKL